MSDEPNRVRSFVEVWARRVLTIGRFGLGADKEGEENWITRRRF